MGGNMQSEVTVRIKGEDSSFKKKFLEYDLIVLDEQSPVLKELVQSALDEYKGIPEEIKIKCEVIWLNPPSSKEQSA
jgi:hypothetical protein